MYNLIKLKALIFLFISTTNAYNFKLCCPFAHQYNSSSDTCFSNLETQNFKIYNSTEEVNEISGKVLNIINYSWCRIDDGPREIEEITDPYYLQENGTLYVPMRHEEYNSNRFCLSITDSNEDLTPVRNIPIICKIEEIEEYSTTTIELSTIKTTLPTTTTISADTTLSNNANCECNTEPPKLPEFLCENLFDGLYEKCVKCTIQNTCNQEECTTDISSIEFVNVFKDTKSIHVVQVNKRKCPYWQYTYNLNKNNTMHIEILKQTCDKLENSNTKATFNTGILLYSGVAFSIIVMLALLGVILYFIRQKRLDANQYAALVKQMNTQETEINPMFRPNTAIYSLPDNIKFS